MVDIGYDRRTLTDPYFLYKKKDYQESVEHEKAPHVRFYAKDYVDFAETSESLSGVEMRDTQSLTIQTFIGNANISFNKEDWVYDIKGKKWWCIDSVTQMDDGQMKECSNRPRTWYILGLIR